MATLDDTPLWWDMRLHLLPYYEYVLGLPTLPIAGIYFGAVMLNANWRHLVPKIDVYYPKLLHSVVCAAINGFVLVGISNELQFVVPTIVSHTMHKPFVRYFFLFCFCKVVELVDTAYVFMKHTSHKMTMLHVYEHATIMIMANIVYHKTNWTCLAPIVMLHAMTQCAQYTYQCHYLLVSKAFYVDVQRVLLEVRGVTFALCLFYSLLLYMQRMITIVLPLYQLSLVLIWLVCYLQVYGRTTSPMRRRWELKERRRSMRQRVERGGVRRRVAR